MKQPYKYWTRDQLYAHLITQCLNFSYSEYDIAEIKRMVYDPNWNPSEDFNGCNVVQDHLHPFLPCFVHDYRWVVGEGGIKSDEEFHANLIKCGVSRVRAILYFVAVRIGWLLFYKWKNKLKKSVSL
jgi:hypothetical protein